jgi:hypothetical protein
MSGTPWLSSTPASVNRKNKTSTITLDGDDIALLDKTKYKIVTCSADGSGYLEDHVYYFSEDGSVETDLTALPDHTHSSASGDGGPMTFMYIKSPASALDLYLSRPTDMIKANWNQTVTGTGSIEDGGGGSSTPYIRLRPNGTSGSGSTISYTNAYPRYTFDGGAMILTFVGNFETATSLAFHGGINCDDVTAADSNTVKVQAEVCTVTNSNWWIRTATGAANSASDTGVAISTDDKSIKLIHDSTGTPYAVISVNSGGEFTKTTNVPATATNNTIGNLLKFSIKNSTAADRPYRFKGARLSWSTSDIWSYGAI